MDLLEKLCRKREHFVTDQWAIDAILKKEILTHNVFDPCCGTGVFGEAAENHGYNVVSRDIEHWGYDLQNRCEDFLADGNHPPFEVGEDFSVFINPPFTLADDFVEKSFYLGARKVLCFQRFAWLESSKRRVFWDKYPPSRVWLCGSRATCWR